MGAERKLRLAVIEDNNDLCEMLVEDLRSEGYETEGYRSVEDYKSANHTVDLFLLDINLPGMSGIEFAKEIRALDRDKGIIVLSVRTGSEHRTEGYLSGVDLYLQKPCGSIELLAAVRRVVERLKWKDGAATCESQQYQLIVDRFAFVGSSTEVLLSAREVGLLVELIAADNQQLSYASCKFLYSGDKNCSTSALHVGIGRLRNKLHSVTGMQNTIVAVRGEGYRLVINISISQALQSHMGDFAWGS